MRNETTIQHNQDQHNTESDPNCWLCPASGTVQPPTIWAQ